MDKKETERLRTENARQRLLAQLEEGFAPSVKTNDPQFRQLAALEFIAFTMGELVKEIRQLRQANEKREKS
jgi:hypothetical protein